MSDYGKMEFVPKERHRLTSKVEKRKTFAK
jgi:hypothetical protein